MNLEYFHLIRHCKKPWFFAKMALFLIERILNRFRRIYGQKTTFYPKIVKNMLLQVQNFSIPPINNTYLVTPLELQLITREVLLEDDQVWSMQFEDPEELCALHRWGYLLLWVTVDEKRNPKQSALALIESWQRVMMSKIFGTPWESYSTGERVCNAILFLSFADKDRINISVLPVIPEWLAQGLLFQASYLARRIEYHEKQATGNHILNNARALYFTGQVLKQPSFSNLARAIFKNDINIIIDSGGFLREGSSHYQFLVTRWILEVLWLAELTHDGVMQELLGPIARQMVEKCWFFLVFNDVEQSWAIPLIGDVSPDFSWQWLISLPWSTLALKYYYPPVLPTPSAEKGWSNLFGITESADKKIHFTKYHRPQLKTFKENGWYRLDFESLTIFWHVEPLGAPAHASHGHCDIGSFCLYWQGREIFIDTGRLNYRTDDPLGMYALSARAHNGVTVDGSDPFIYESRSHYPKKYRLGHVIVNSNLTDDACFLSIEHDGFSRLYGDAIQFKREFYITQDQLIIKDYFTGQCQHVVDTYFQLGSNVALCTMSDTKYSFEIAGFKGVFTGHSVMNNLELVPVVLSAINPPKPSGWVFPGYGKKEPANTLQFSNQVTFPAIFEYQLQWN